MKKTISIFLCLMIIFNIVFVPKKVEAVALTATATVLGAEAVKAVAGLLIATGIVYGTKESAEYLAQKWWRQADINTRQSFIDSYDSVIDGVMIVPNAVWESARTFAQSIINIGSNIFDVHDWITYDSIAEVPYGISKAYAVELGTGLEYADRPVINVVDYNNSFYYGCKIYVGGNYHSCAQYEADGNNHSLVLYINTALQQPKMTLGIKYINNGNVEIHDLSDGINGAMVDFIATDFADVVANYLTTVPASVTFTGADVLSNPTYDFEEEGTREIAIPTTENITDLTYTDVQNPSVSSTPTVDDPIYTPPADAVAFDFTPLLTIPEALAQKFPFCIPFDLKNAVVGLVSTPKAPKWDVHLDDGFVGSADFEIDFEKFEAWASIIRWGILIIFNIALIKSTRKLIGG